MPAAAPDPAPAAVATANAHAPTDTAAAEDVNLAPTDSSTGGAEGFSAAAPDTPVEKLPLDINTPVALIHSFEGEIEHLPGRITSRSDAQPHTYSMKLAHSGATMSELLRNVLVGFGECDGCLLDRMHRRLRRRLDEARKGITPSQANLQEAVQIEQVSLSSFCGVKVNNNFDSVYTHLLPPTLSH